MSNGTVKFFNDSKGFGFITPEEGNKDVFVHISGLVDEVNEGDRVSFDVEETPKGLIISLIPFLDLIFFKKHISFEIIQHAFGIKTKVMEDCIPEKAQAKVIFSSRIYAAIWLLIILEIIILLKI